MPHETSTPSPTGTSPYRKYLPQLGNKKLKELPNCNAHEWAAHRCSVEPFISNWVAEWNETLKQPYKGITTDGNVIPKLFPIAADGQDHGAPTASMLSAAQALLATATDAERTALSHPLDSPQWRSWNNPELYIFKSGVRLEESSRPLVTSIHALLRASLSPSGYLKAVGCMKTNAFLGRLVHGEKVMNEESFNFVLFGTPSRTGPWGWQLYGHHLVLNVCVVGTQIVFSPVFMGAEPNFIDEGPETDVFLFHAQEEQGLALIRSLGPEMQQEAIIYHELHDPAMPEGRFHRADQRHLGGVTQDNRIISYEGIPVSKLHTAQQKEVQALLRLSLDMYPEAALDAKMAEIRLHWQDTYFAWIGGTSDTDAFYYKIHSPVIMVEFDHHSGVFLTNEKPEKFHIHTIVRTPNGGDYGKALIKQWEASRAGSGM